MSAEASLRLHAAAAAQADLNARIQQQASAMVDPLALAAAATSSARKRAHSVSPYSAELDLCAAIIRHSPTLQAAAAAERGSPSSSGSYGHISPVALAQLSQHPAHQIQQQLQAVHLLRSAQQSPMYHQLAAVSSYFPHLFTSSPMTTTASAAAATTTSTASAATTKTTAASQTKPMMAPEKEKKVQVEDVVSSTIEDEDQLEISKVCPDWFATVKNDY